MIIFRCSGCNQKYKADDNFLGKEVICKKCGQPFIVTAVAAPPNGIKNETLKIPDPDQSQDNHQYEDPRLQTSLVSGTQHYSGKRTYPFIFDLFLYPYSKAGLFMLLIFFGIPFILRLLGLLTTALTVVFVPFLPIAILIKILGALINAVFWLYMFWYYGQCVYESALGSTRAPDTMSQTPAFGEIFSNLFKIIACIAVFTLPAMIYSHTTGRIDNIFFVLVAFGIFCFPMAFLAVIMFDSFYGLNPILIAASIKSTFFPYIGLCLLLALLQAIFTACSYLLFIVPFARVLIPALSAIGMMISGHLLGRFFYKYEQRLNWDV
ncbi:MAG: hypothetical protein H8D47_04100 [Planctomycetes bacterium]|nr:hypothetical protein [Planctomycetota bacterium]MBL7105977.1 hypothetical protein [Phycisphaerae bacterium]